MVWALRWTRGLLATACLIGLGCWTGRALPPSIALYRSCDFADTYNTYYQERLQQAVAAQQWKRAADLLADYASHEPPHMADGPRAVPRSAEEQRIASILADINSDCGAAYNQAGDRDAAEKHFARAAQLKRFCQP